MGISNNPMLAGIDIDARHLELMDNLTGPGRIIAFPHEFHVYFSSSMASGSKKIPKDVSEWVLHRLFTYDVIVSVRSKLREIFQNRFLSSSKIVDAGVLAVVYEQEAGDMMREVHDFWKENGAGNFTTFENNVRALARPSYNKELIRVVKRVVKFVDEYFGKASARSKGGSVKRTATKSIKSKKSVGVKRTATKKATKGKSGGVKRAATKRTVKGKARCGGSFFRFLAEQRDFIRSEYRVTKSSEIASIGGEMWRGLTDVQKRKYCKK